VRCSAISVEAINGNSSLIPQTLLLPLSSNGLYAGRLWNSSKPKVTAEPQMESTGRQTNQFICFSKLRFMVLANGKIYFVEPMITLVSAVLCRLRIIPNSNIFKKEITQQYLSFTTGNTYVTLSEFSQNIFK
jgi:hypothetical protein